MALAEAVCAPKLMTSCCSSGPPARASTCSELRSLTSIMPCTATNVLGTQNINFTHYVTLCPAQPQTCWVHKTSAYNISKHLHQLLLPF